MRQHGLSTGLNIVPFWGARLAVAFCVPCISAHQLVGSSAASSGQWTATPSRCSDAELASYALLASTGPVPGSRALQPPSCIPTSKQGLWPLSVGSLAEQHAEVHAGSEKDIQKQTEMVQAPHLAHLYVAQSYAEWCKAPCQAATWELAAPKPMLNSTYVLFEAAIWRQERRVALYQFDPAWEKRARHAYHDVCFGMGWECYNYKVFRENRSLLSIGPWPASADKNYGELSKFLLSAFDRIFAKIRESVPRAEHFALTYSGHGASADGSLFEGVLQKRDSATWLKSVTGMTGRLAMLNFGGNCAEGRWNMVAHLHPYADWIIASDLKVGGVALNDEENTMETVHARERLSDVTILKQAGEAKSSVLSMVEQVVQARVKLWKEVWKAPIKRQKLRQSIAAYHGPDFPAFQKALRLGYAELPIARRKEWEERVEDAECDVLAAARLLAEMAPSSSTSELEKSFKTMRPMFASTSGMVDWEVQLHGLGFNFNGWKGPPCDFKTALGPGTKPPEGWNGGGTPEPMDIR